MDSDHLILAHGAAGSTIDMLVGLGPVILGAVLIGAFILLLSTDRANAVRSGYRDETPTSARLLFSGTYYHLEEMLQHDHSPTVPPARRPEHTAAGRG